MAHLTTEEHDKILDILVENILEIPGVASIPKNGQDEMKIHIARNNLGWIVNININCFFYVNIWSVLKQVQNQSLYIMEKLSKHREAVKVHVRVADLILEDNQ